MVNLRVQDVINDELMWLLVFFSESLVVIVIVLVRWRNLWIHQKLCCLHLMKYYQQM